MLIKFKSQKAVSLIFVILILGSLLPIGLIVSQIVLFEGQRIRATGSSEIAYYAAESGIEEGAYRINKDKANPIGLSFTGLLPNDKASYMIEDSTLVNESVPWLVNIPANQSFQLDLDLNTIYPDSISIDAPSDNTGEVYLFSWERSNSQGTEIEMENSVPPSVSYSLDPLRYYRLRIRNLHSSPVTFTLVAPSAIPAGFKIESSGFFQKFKRKIEAVFYKYQFF